MAYLDYQDLRSTGRVYLPASNTESHIALTFQPPSEKLPIAILFNCSGRLYIDILKPDGTNAGQVVYFGAPVTTTYENYHRTILIDASTYNGSGTDWLIRVTPSDLNSDAWIEMLLYYIVDPSVYTLAEQAGDVQADLLTPLPLNEGNYFEFYVAEGGVGTVEPGDQTPTAKHLITGNVKKLDLPFQANVVAVSTGREPEVLASTQSDSETGDYFLDVWPYDGDCLLYVAPEYGIGFSPDFFMSSGQVVHPTLPNGYVYVAQGDGQLPNNEPAWVTEGLFNAGTLSLLAVPLYRPLMNGFIKPTILPI